MDNRMIKLLMIGGFLSVANLCAMDSVTCDVEAQFNVYLHPEVLNLKDADDLLRNFVEQVDRDAYGKMARRLLGIYLAKLNYKGMESFLNFLVERAVLGGAEVSDWYGRLESAVVTSSSCASSSTKKFDGCPAAAKRTENLPVEKMVHRVEFLPGLLKSARTAFTVFREPDATRVAARIYAAIIKYAVQNGLQSSFECLEAQRELALIKRDGV